MGKPAVPKGIKESVESIEDGFHVALGRLNTIRDRQNGPRDYKPIPKDQLDELEFQLNRGPSTIKELYSRAAKRHVCSAPVACLCKYRILIQIGEGQI